MFYERSEDYRPLFWLQGHPIYVNTLIFLGHIVAFALGALAFSIMGPLVVELLSLNTEAVMYGQVWRLVTYIVFLPLDAWSSVNFIFAMGFLFTFGKQVEEYIGRGTYAKLFAALVLIPAVLICLVGLWQPIDFAIGGMGSIFGVFVAFATIYPGVSINIWFTNLTAKGWCFALLAVLSLTDIAYHAWVALAALWCDAAIAYLGMRLVGAGRGMEWLTNWLEERRAQRLARKHNLKIVQEKKSTESIDAILDKISKQGVGSLDAQERAALERARTKLIQRDQR